MALESVTSLSPGRGKSFQFWSRRKMTPYLFFLPFGLVFLLFFIVPIFYAIYQSLFRSQRSGLGLGAPTINFNGLNNYSQVIHDPDFYTGVGRVLLFGIVQVPIMLGLALLLALLLDSTVVRFRPFFRLAFFVPYAIPGVIAALLWDYLYDPGISPIVKGVSGLGLGSPDFLGSNTVLWSIANIVTWTWTGYNMLIIFAALQAIPPELYESARIDGASGWRIAWRIKIPLVAPALVLTCIFSIIGTLQLFNEPFVLSTISNNISTSYTPNFFAYYTAFANNNYYYAAAIAVVLAVVTCVLSFGFLRVTRRLSGV
ncbi:MAG TPA: sugar ABC transporter permease [Ktedonobacteraceae bacterium]|nr:sugar ABC transporter permease [Ktedonobacteraceae bacterium]